MNDCTEEYMTCPPIIASDNRFSRVEQILLLWYFSLARKTGRCRPSDEAARKYLGCENVGTIKNINSSLEKKGGIYRFEEEGVRWIIPSKNLLGHVNDDLVNNLVGHVNDDEEISRSCNPLPLGHVIHEKQVMESMTLPPLPPNKDSIRTGVRGRCISALARDPLPSPLLSQNSKEQGQAAPPKLGDSTPPQPARPSPSSSPFSSSSFSNPPAFRDKRNIRISEAQFENLVDQYTPILDYDQARVFVYKEIEKLDRFLSDKPGAYRGKHYETLAEWCLGDISKNKLPQETSFPSPQPHGPGGPPKTENDKLKKIELNKQFVKDDLARFPEHRKFVVINSMSVTIWAREGSTELLYEEEGFQEQLLNGLQKSGAISSSTPSSLPKDMGFLPKQTEQQLKAKMLTYVDKFTSRHPKTAGKIALHPESVAFTLLDGSKKEIAYSEKNAEVDMVNLLEEMKKYDEI